MLTAEEYHIYYLSDGWSIVDVGFDNITGECDGAVDVLLAATLEAALAWCGAQAPNKTVTVHGANWFQSGLPRPLLYSWQDPRIGEALEAAFRYGAIDGAHHKTWVIDQMVRALLGAKYEGWVEEFCDGKDGPQTYEWDEGIPP